MNYSLIPRVSVLEELIAPKHVEFYASDWSFIGTKLQRREQISKITGISAAVLDHSHDGEIVAANKMSWAAKRETTRSEDRAYCLLGLFGVNMPLLYGEGGARAFIRLQEEIMRRREDHSLFLWERPFRSDPKLPLLSTSPAFFAHIRTANLGETLPKAPALTDISQLNIVHGNNRWAYHSLHGGTTREIGLPISFTSQGVRLNLWLLDIRDLRILPLEVEETTTHIALLNLHLGPSYVYIGIYLRVLESATNVFRRNDMTYCIITKSIWDHYSDKQRYVELYIDQPEHQNIPAPVTLEPPPTLPDAIILDVNRNQFRAVACTWSLNKAASGSTKYGLFLNQSGRLVVKSANPNPFELCLTLRHGTETKMEELGVKLRFSAKTELSSPGFSIKCDIQAAQVKEWQKGSTSSVWDDRHSESTVSDGQLVTVGTRMRVCVGMKPLGPLFEPGASDRYIPTYRLYIEDLNMSGNQSKKSGDSSSWNQQDFWQKVFSEDARGKGIQVHDVQEREIEVPKITVQQPA